MSNIDIFTSILRKDGIWSIMGKRWDFEVGNFLGKLGNDKNRI